MRKIYHLCAAVILSLLAGPMSQAQTVHAPGRQRSAVPFTQKVSGGQARPIVTAYFNGKPMKMMVHSNASFTAQLKHHQARAFQLTDMKRIGRYGINRAGHVSDAGFSKGVAHELSVGRTIDRDAPINVFEVPQDEYGMLGIDWIREHRAIVDYQRGLVVLNPSAAESAALRKRLLKSGYAAVPMTYRAGRYTVEGTVGDVAGRMMVATASGTSIDPVFAKDAGLGLGKIVSQGAGPTGTSIPMYALTAPLKVGLGAFRSRPLSDALVFDAYAYSAEARPTSLRNATVATLGSDFLTVSGAIVDFNTGTLFVR